MNIAPALSLADSWGVRGGWWIVMCVLMMGCMAAMMLGMARMGTHREGGRPALWDRLMTSETPMVILHRRFAEGLISLDDYEERKQQLAKQTPRERELPESQRPTAIGSP